MHHGDIRSVHGGSHNVLHGGYIVGGGSMEGFRVKNNSRIGVDVIPEQDDRRAVLQVRQGIRRIRRQQV